MMVYSKQQLLESTKYLFSSKFISDMINLDKINTDTTTKIVRLFRFNMEVFSWLKVPTPVEFCEEKEAIRSGGFRKAFKAFKEQTFKGFFRM